MPLVSSAYNPPHVFKNGHVSTIYSGIFRQVNGIKQERERIKTKDSDFLDLDWSFSSTRIRKNSSLGHSDKLIVMLHGLEGNAQRPYITGTAKIFNENGFDACAINFRSCSGEPNRLFRSYHSGASEDLEEVIEHILINKKYASIILKGFSLGGNITLKYLGEHHDLPKEIKAAIAVSVPCLLYGSMLEIHKFKNILYSHRFKKHLLEKLKSKQQLFPEKISDDDLKKIITLKDFDDFYTSRAHGFKDALDYYEKSSSLYHLHNIKIPSLILNAKNDSFLSQECFPVEAASKNNRLYLEMPYYGGHVGFYDKNNIFYNEKRALRFIEETLI